MVGSILLPIGSYRISGIPSDVVSGVTIQGDRNTTNTNYSSNKLTGSATDKGFGTVV